EAAREVPYGAFCHVLPEQVPCADRLVLSVDDAHLLDAASAALLHQLAAGGRAFLLVTTERGAACPADLPRLALGPLRAADVAEGCGRWTWAGARMYGWRIPDMARFCGPRPGRSRPRCCAASWPRRWRRSARADARIRCGWRCGGWRAVRRARRARWSPRAGW